MNILNRFINVLFDFGKTEIPFAELKNEIKKKMNGLMARVAPAVSYRTVAREKGFRRKRKRNHRTKATQNTIFTFRIRGFLGLIPQTANHNLWLRFMLNYAFWW